VNLRGYINRELQLETTTAPMRLSDLMGGSHLFLGGAYGGGGVVSGQHYQGYVRNFQMYHRPATNDEVISNLPGTISMYN
jgi:hypothetical protein